MPQSSVARRIGSGAVPTAVTSILTVSAVDRYVLSSVRFHNSSGATRHVEMWVVPVGESPDSSNKFVATDILDDGTYNEYGIGQVLEPGDQVYLDADGIDVSYKLSGALLTDV